MWSLTAQVVTHGEAKTDIGSSKGHQRLSTTQTWSPDKSAFRLTSHLSLDATEVYTGYSIATLVNNSTSCS